MTADMVSRIETLENQMIGMRGDLSLAFTGIEDKEKTFLDNTNLEFTKHQQAMHEIVQQARADFDQIKAQMMGLAGTFGNEVLGLKAKIEEMEGWGKEEEDPKRRKDTYL